MATCYSITVALDQGALYDLCLTHVPGNDDLAQEVERAGIETRSPRKPTRQEVQRAADYFNEQERRGHERQGAPYWV